MKKVRTNYSGIEEVFSAMCCSGILTRSVILLLVVLSVSYFNAQKSISFLKINVSLIIVNHGKTQIPQSLEVEHKELHEQLKKAIDSGGKTGDAAKAVAELLHPHFEKEEEYAMPPLGLLSQLSRETKEGEVEVTTTKDTQQKILATADKLKEDLPDMLEEYKQSLVLQKCMQPSKRINQNIFTLQKSLRYMPKQKKKFYTQLQYQLANT